MRDSEEAREVLGLKGDVRCIALRRSWCGRECSCFVCGSVSGGNGGLGLCEGPGLGLIGIFPTQATLRVRVRVAYPINPINHQTSTLYQC